MPKKRSHSIHSQKTDQQYHSPKAIDQEALSISFYKASLPLEQEKLGNDKRHRQLILEEVKLDDDELEREVAITGLSLTSEQDKALSAVQILLDSTNYQGNIGKNNSIKITVDQFYDAYGLERKYRASDKTHKHSSRQHTRALTALKSLAQESQKLIYQAVWYEKGRKQSVVKRYTGTLINLLESTDILKEDDPFFPAEELDQIVDKRVSFLIIEPSEIVLSGIPLTDNRSGFYILKDPDLHNKIKEWYEDKRGSRGRIPDTAQLFIGSWLASKNYHTVKISEDELIERLRLQSHREKKGLNWVREERLDIAFECAQDLGYLLNWEAGYKGLSPKRMYTFKLNPEMLSRVQDRDLEEEIS